MCTAITYQTKDHYFGRNLDLEYSYREQVTITPRNYSFSFRCLPPLDSHFAMIGMAVISKNYPLYYDATNEHGLSIAALNFPHSTQYMPGDPDKINVAPFELIPWLLGSCKTLQQVREHLTQCNIVQIPFSAEYPLTPLHWIAADAKESLVIEQTAEGLKVYNNPVGVLTNEPAFPYHMTNLKNYRHISCEDTDNRFAPGLKLNAYSKGMGGMGLPGDLSSSSRFVRAAFTKWNSVSKDAESASISQVFHILGSVAQQQGCVKVGHLYEKTVYTSCCNTVKGIYYYTTYENSQITGVRLHGTDLDGAKLISYPLVCTQQIRMMN